MPVVWPCDTLDSRCTQVHWLSIAETPNVAEMFPNGWVLHLCIQNFENRWNIQKVHSMYSMVDECKHGINKIVCVPHHKITKFNALQSGMLQMC